MIDDDDPTTTAAVVEALAITLRRVATDLVIAARLADLVDLPNGWFTSCAVLCADFAHELHPLNNQEDQ